MSFASLGKAAISCRQGLLLTGFAVLFCICTQLRPVAYAQDVPSAPAPQPVPAAPAKPPSNSSPSPRKTPKPSSLRD